MTKMDIKDLIIFTIAMILIYHVLMMKPFRSAYYEFMLTSILKTNTSPTKFEPYLMIRMFLLMTVGVLTILSVAYLLTNCKPGEKVAFILVPLIFIIWIFLTNKLTDEEIVNVNRDPQFLTLGNGLARSYHLGFWRIVLPKFEEKRRIYEETQQIELSGGRKIHVLVPKSCKIYDRLNGLSFLEDLEHCEYKSNFFTFEATVAGNVNRSYSLTTYRFKSQNEASYRYVIAHQASNLPALKDRWPNLPDQLFDQQLKLYADMLRHYIQESGYGHLVTIVEYADEKDGEMVALSKIILKEIYRGQAASRPLLSSGDRS